MIGYSCREGIDIGGAGGIEWAYALSNYNKNLGIAHQPILRQAFGWTHLLIRRDHAIPNHAMPCPPCLAFLWRREQGRASARACVCVEKGSALKPSQTSTNPQCHPNTPLYLEIGSCSAYFFWYHDIAMANTHFYKKNLGIAHETILQ